MTRTRPATLLRYLREFTARQDPGGPSDGELLGRFVRLRDEAAFEMLVWRHGKMVWNLCRRLLRHPQDADLDETTWRDLKPVLDAEIDRLPEKYRAAVILCYLEGHSTTEAAALLGCPKGTVLSRLAGARQRLQRRLTRRGLTLSLVAL